MNLNWDATGELVAAILLPNQAHRYLVRTGEGADTFTFIEERELLVNPPSSLGIGTVEEDMPLCAQALADIIADEGLDAVVHPVWRKRRTFTVEEALAADRRGEFDAEVS